MNKKLLLVITFASLVGCGHPLPKPVDPLRGLDASSNKQVQHMPAMKWAPPSSIEETFGKPLQHVDLRPYQNQKIGLILSENTRNSVKWRKEEIDRINSNFADVSWASSSDVDSIQSSDHSGLAISVERVLKEKFRNLALVQDIHAAINEGINAVVVIDIQATADKTCPSSVSDCYLDTKSQHSLIFVDTQTRNTLTVLRGEASITYCNLPKVDFDFAYAKCIQDGRIRSLEVLRGKLAAELPDTTDKDVVVQKSPAGSASALGYEENRDTIENGAPAEMYSLGLRMEHAANAALAGLVYQAIVRRFPDSPFAAKAIERQEGMAAR